jgi:hypothetical protein
MIKAMVLAGFVALVGRILSAYTQPPVEQV